MEHQRRISLVILAYPFGVLVISVLVNIFVFGVRPIALALPSDEVLWTLALAATLLVINHTWLMTSTELTRLRYEMFATPEEWAASGKSRANVGMRAEEELERRHNAHRNTTENVVYFVLSASVFSIISPPVMASLTWILGFALARLGYTYSYLHGKDSARGLLMSLSLIAMYGLVSYVLLALFGSV